MAPTCSHTVERDHNKAGELAIGNANFTLADVSADICRSIGNWQECTELAMNLNNNLRRGDVLGEQRCDGALVCATLGLDNRPRTGGMLNRREVLAHELVDAACIHAG